MTLSSASITLANESREKIQTGGGFVQNVLSVKDRYFLTLGLRGDYNSVFGQEIQGILQIFPKASLSYVISDESFWPLALGQLKLRGAWGQAGRAPGTFDAVRTWSAIGWGGDMAFDPQNVGNDSLGPERTTEYEFGFEGEFLGSRLALEFTYYKQKTTDALFSVRQLPSMGSWNSQLANVGTIENRGIELAANAIILPNPDLGLDVGFTVYTNHSRVLDLGDAVPFGMGGSGWILPPDTNATGEVTYYPVPAMRNDCIIASESDSTIQFYTSTVTGTPTIAKNCVYGPNLPTLTLGFNTTLRLPKGIQLVARGEFQGGGFTTDGASSQGTTRSIKWPFCFEAYPVIEAGNEAQLSTFLQSTCIPANADGDYLTYPTDFFKLRELSLRVPVGFAIPGSGSAMLTLSARNAFRWINKDFPVFDPEMMGNTGMNASVRGMSEHVPPPATFTAQLRVVF